MKKVLIALMAVLITVALAGIGTYAYFSDTETSNGNTFAAGTLDLNVDGGNTNVVKFTVTNMKPGNQPKKSFTLANVGTINGYLDLENIVVTDAENGRLDPEIDAGDTTDGTGELQNVVNVRLFIDYGGDGWISSGDDVFYNGLVKDLPGNFELDESINAGSSINIVALFDWWNTPDDNQAQSDSMTLDITFELGQDASQ